MSSLYDFQFAQLIIPCTITTNIVAIFPLILSLLSVFMVIHSFLMSKNLPVCSTRRYAASWIQTCDKCPASPSVSHGFLAPQHVRPKSPESHRRFVWCAVCEQ